MPVIRNKSAGPRFFNLKVGAKNSISERILAPGEAAELDLLVDPQDDDALKALVEAGEVEVLTGAKAKAALTGDKDAEKMAELEKAVAEGEAARAKLAELQATASADASFRTPPRQFGGDGGPEQMPTVDGRGGAPTKVQEEAAKSGDAREASQKQQAEMAKEAQKPPAVRKA